MPAFSTRPSGKIPATRKLISNASGKFPMDHGGAEGRGTGRPSCLSGKAADLPIVHRRKGRKRAPLPHRGPGRPKLSIGDLGPTALEPLFLTSKPLPTYQAAKDSDCIACQPVSSSHELVVKRQTSVRNAAAARGNSGPRFDLTM